MAEPRAGQTEKAQSFGYGSQTWPSLDALMCDAAGMRFHKDASQQLRYMLAAVVQAAGGEIRVPAINIHARLEVQCSAVDNTVILKVVGRD